MNLKNSKTLKNFFEKYFYQQDTETALRYYPVVSQIKKANLADSKILEIGSGPLGITPYIKKPIDGLDVDFSGPKSALVNRIKHSADKLPFGKDFYDVTIAVDVFEHLEPNLRQSAIYEMLRVTKKLSIIVIPTSEDSQQQDRLFHDIWTKTFNIKNRSLEQHLKYGLPEANELLVYIDKSLRKLNKKATISSYPNLNLQVRFMLIRTNYTKSVFLNFIYLKGYLLLLPVLRFCNFGKTYRRVFVIEFGSENRD